MNAGLRQSQLLCDPQLKLKKKNNKTKRGIANNIHRVFILHPSARSDTPRLSFCLFVCLFSLNQAERTCWCPDLKGSAWQLLLLLPTSRAKDYIQSAIYIHTYIFILSKNNLFNKLKITKSRYIVSR